MNPENAADAFDYTVLSEPERLALELRWYEGRMLPYAEWVLAFVERHRAELLAAANGSGDPGVLLAATKALIIERGSVHMAAELKDQMREIENELWYRGEKGEYDRAGIQADWTTRYAVAWRRWRIREYLFVTDRCAGRVVRVLQPSPPAPHEPAQLDAVQPGDLFSPNSPGAP